MSMLLRSAPGPQRTVFVAASGRSDEVLISVRAEPVEAHANPSTGSGRTVHISKGRNQQLQGDHPHQTATQPTVSSVDPAFAMLLNRYGVVLRVDLGLRGEVSVEGVGHFFMLSVRSEKPMARKVKGGSSSCPS